MLSPRAIVLLAALVTGLLLAGLSCCKAHSWYPADCCSDRDCAPIPSSDVDETAEGFVIKSTGEFIERSKAKMAPDDQFHICRYPSSKIIICFFQPNRGV